MSRQNDDGVPSLGALIMTRTRRSKADELMRRTEHGSFWGLVAGLCSLAYLPMLPFSELSERQRSRSAGKASGCSSFRFRSRTPFIFPWVYIRCQRRPSTITKHEDRVVHILAGHSHLISCTFTAFPEPGSGFPGQGGVADTAVFWTVVLFPRAEATAVI